MEQTVKQRLMMFIEHLGISMNAFERECGLGKRYVANIRKSIQPDTLEKIALTYPELNKGWLMTGEGEMLKGEKVVGVPLLDGEQVRAGAMAGFGSALTASDLIRLPELHWHDGDFAVRVNGRSMIDPLRPSQSIPDGATVVLRPWTESYIHWGETYCVYTSNGYAIKRLMPGDDDEHIKCVSNNESEGYETYQILKSDILGLARVTAVITLTTLWA